MAIAISSQMASSLVALTSTNNDISSTQNKLSTGLAIASASDNLAVFFKAKSYSTKAMDLDNVNKNISQAVANLDTVDKALSNIQETLKGARDLMKDARSKAMPLGLVANAAGDTIYGSRAADATAVPPVRALTGRIVSSNSNLIANTAAPSDVNDGTIFQQGDVFAITINDTANTGSNGKVTRYFRATSTETAVSQNAQTLGAGGQFVDATTAGQIATAPANVARADGLTQNKAMNFNDMASLKAAIESAFGSDTITLNMNEQTAGSGNYKLGFSLPSTSQTITFMQTNDQAQGTTEPGLPGPNNTFTNTDPGTSFNFAALFGRQQGFVTNAAGVQLFNNNGTPQTQFNKSPEQGLTTLNNVTGNAYTYAPAGPPKSATDAVLQSRKEAADFFKQTLYGLKNTVADATLPGFSNILAGETLTVALNEIGSVNQTVKLGKAIDPLNLGFAGYTDNGGVVNTTASIADFATDADLNVALAQVDTALGVLKQNQTYIAAAKVQINARADYNKFVVSTLNMGATEMTAADTTSEAASLAALQNRQSFATNNMAMTKQAEQSLIQLLR